MQTPSTRRLKVSEVAAARLYFATAQGGRCAICQLPLNREVLDHCHSTGNVRATLHAGCNSVLGKIENSYKRYGVPNLAAFLAGVAPYLQKHVTNQTGLIHPTHKSPEEKRVRTNALARKRRAATKA